MLVKFIDIECLHENYKIDIEEQQTVENFRKSVEDQSSRKLQNKYFHFVYGNIILNDDKWVSFYNIHINDEIQFGKLENFLQENDAIVELFINRHSPELIYLVLKKNDSISKIKSIISSLIPNIGKIFNTNGQQMRDEQIVNDIDIDEYYKLIIGCDDLMTAEYHDSLKIRDQYLTTNYLATFGWLYWWQYKVKLGNKNRWMKIINDSKKLITNDEENQLLNIDLLLLPISFIQSKYIFCVDMTNRISELCNFYWKSIIKDYERNGKYFVGYFHATLYVAMINYISNSQINDNLLIKNIILNALDHFIDYLNNRLNEYHHLIKSFLDKFWHRSYKIKEIKEIIGANNIQNTQLFVKMGDQEYQLGIIKERKTIHQIKRSISCKTGIPLQNVHCIKQYGEGEGPKDEDDFNDYYHLIEISLCMNNIEIIELIGKGAFGKVFLCEDKITKCRFALKKPLGIDKDLHREISIYNHLKESRHIEKYKCLFSDNGVLCIAMKYISGGSIRNYLDKGRWFTEKEIAEISHQIIIQVMDLHETGIIHRDIKCENVVLDENNNAKLIDFGISKCTRGLSDEKLIENLKVYEPGTIYCMAPELLKGHLYTTKIDVWSFGIMLFEMITGKKPFFHLNAIQAALQICNMKKIEYIPLQPISAKLKEFIDLCLISNSHERPSMKQLIKTNFVRKY